MVTIKSKGICYRITSIAKVHSHYVFYLSDYAMKGFNYVTLRIKKGTLDEITVDDYKDGVYTESKDKDRIDVIKHWVEQNIDYILETAIKNPRDLLRKEFKC